MILSINMATPPHILNFYSRPTAMTSAGKHTALFDELPEDVDKLIHMIQGLVLYEYVAYDFYGFVIPDQRKRETHLRSIENMLDALLALNNEPLFMARPVHQRLIGICHHFVLLLVAILRAKGIPARYRCGFGAYFNPPYFEEHVVCEYWNALQSRWIIVDPQFDQVWRQKLEVDHDILDVPHDRFIMAGDAWMRCRSGNADPAKFGIFKGDLRGLWFIAGEVVRDLAALNKMEMLPWDSWGAIPYPNEPLNDNQLAFFDRLAISTQSPDDSFSELRSLYEGNDRLHVPTTIFNGVLNCLETI
jgi:hypothetical protein